MNLSVFRQFTSSFHVSFRQSAKIPLKTANNRSTNGHRTVRRQFFQLKRKGVGQLITDSRLTARLLVGNLWTIVSAQRGPKNVAAHA